MWRVNSSCFLSTSSDCSLYTSQNDNRLEFALTQQLMMAVAKKVQSRRNLHRREATAGKEARVGGLSCLFRSTPFEVISGTNSQHCPPLSCRCGSLDPFTTVPQSLLPTNLQRSQLLADYRFCKLCFRRCWHCCCKAVCCWMADRDRGPVPVPGFCCSVARAQPSLSLSHRTAKANAPTICSTAHLHLTAPLQNGRPRVFPRQPLEEASVRRI